MSVEDLDTHHKKVLSDDWGVGIALQWLSTRMRYKYIAHGAIVMDVLRARNVAQFVGRKKYGPFKCPDFFAVDQKDKIHLIECKGNQEGPTHIDKQFIRGRQQKTNVRFNDESLVGQRLLTGVAISSPTKKWPSTLKVADPSPDEDLGYYNIEVKNAIPLVESLKKVVLMQGLISAGALKIAHTLFPEETHTHEVRIVNDPPTTRFVTNAEQWIGQVYEVPFPIPIELPDRSSIASCRMRVGAGASLLDRLKIQSGPDHQNAIVRGTELDLRMEKESARVEAGDDGNLEKLPQEEHVGRYASIQYGNAFIADLELLEG